MSLKKITLPLLFFVALLGGAGYFFYPALFSAPQPFSPVALQATTLMQQSDALQNAFKRMLSLGYKAEDIGYNTGLPSDIIGTTGILDAPIIPPANTLTRAATQWALGGGQLVGTFNEDATDTAFYLSDITQSACRAINTAIWLDTPDALPASNTTTDDWHKRQANILEALPEKSRSTGCLATNDGNYIYYFVVQQR